MKKKFYSLLLTSILGLLGMQVGAQELTTTEIDGVSYYEIKTGDDLKVFADMVNAGTFDANAVLTADNGIIDMTGVEMEVIGNSPDNAYQGTFNGNNQTITNYSLNVDNFEASFGYGMFGNTNGATIKDFTIDGNIIFDGPAANSDYGCGLIGWPDGGTLIQNIKSTVNIEGKVYRHVGGIVGSLRTATIDRCEYAGTLNGYESNNGVAGIAAYTNTGTITNCIFSGTITGNGSGYFAGILGYVNNTNATVKNCLSYGQIDNTGSSKYQGVLVARLRNIGTYSNNYYKNGDEGITGEVATNASNISNTTKVTDEQLASGEVTYKLNGDQSDINFYQTLPDDIAPTLDATHGTVYGEGTVCIGTGAPQNVTYSNTPGTGIVESDHVFVDGFCCYCGLFDVTYMTPDENGYYQIGTPAQLIWFAYRVNTGMYDANAMLTADIDMEGADISRFPIGSTTDATGGRYEGTFDGQGHKFSNFKLIRPDAPKNFGLFNTNTGVVLKNFWFDETCEIEGTEVTGLIGRHDGGGYFEGLGNFANVTGKNNNIGGLFGAIFGNSSDKKQVTIKNCWSAGTVLSTNTSATNYTDCGALSGWFNNANITIEGFWTIAEVVNPRGDDKYVFRNGSGAKFTIKNCFSMYGAQSNFPNFSENQLTSGEICWKLNGESFIDAAWHQTLGQDQYPLPYGTEPIVYMTSTGDYENISNDSDPNEITDFINKIIESETTFLEDMVAYQALIDQYKAAIESWSDIEGLDEFLEKYKADLELKESVKTSAANYQAYADACDAALTYLNENPGEGEWYDLITAYLQNEVEPGNDYPNGSYSYIMENLSLDDEAITKEIDFMNQMLQNAIAGGITAGTEVTRLLNNPAFAEGFEGWTREAADGMTLASGGTASIMPILRGLGNGTFNVTQSFTEIPNGIYMMSLNGMYRPGADVTYKLHAGQLYMNDTYNFVMTPGEDVIAEGDAEPGVNCLGEGSDALYDDGDIIGWVPNAMTGSSVAFKAGRYQNFCATEVTDGVLAVGVRNLSSGLDSQWLPFGNLHVYYLGTAEEADEDLSQVLEGYKARAQVILDFEHSDSNDDFFVYPNMYKGLKEQIAFTVEQADTLLTGGTLIKGEDKMAIINTFSALFNEVYACRKAYIAMHEAANKLSDIIESLLDAGLIEEEAYNLWNQEIEDARNHYSNDDGEGDVTTEEAIAIAEKLNGCDLMIKPVDGVYQLANARDVMLFSLIVNTRESDAKAVLTEDIDMGEAVTEHGYEPIGTPDHPFKGEFDGQNHKITNFGHYVVEEEGEAGYYDFSLSGDAKGFIGYASGATIKNFSIEGAFEYNGGTGVGAIGWATGTSLSNIHSSLNIAVPDVSHHIGGVCGHLSENSSATNCSFSGSIYDKAGSHDCIGGIGAYSNNGVKYTNCANYGTITYTAANAYAGGICGYVNNNNFTGVFNCLNVGKVGMENGTPTYGGAFVGRLRDHANSKFENNFWLNDSAPNASGENGISATTVSAEQLASGEVCFKLNVSQSEEVDWYQTLGEDEYPLLFDTHKIVYLADDGSYTNEKPSTSPLGSKDNPFVVKTAADLSGLLNLLVSGRTNYIVMQDDVDMAGVTDWTPLFNIPDQSNGYPFIDFDGQGHVIRNLTSNTTGSYDYCGLFGVLCGNVRNLGVENATVECAGGTGILAGYLGHSTYGRPCYIENVWVTGKVTANGYCGGMFGNIADESHITNCYANVEVNGTSDYTGGIIGRVRNKVVMNNVYAAGSSNHGGIIGGGFQTATPAGSYTNVAVWNNTVKNFGPVRDTDEMSGILYYDGNNFADLQSQVVAWDPRVWSCDMEPGSYPILADFDPVGIKGVTASESIQTIGIYNLAGQRLSKPAKGINIVDGKKILVK